MKRGLRRAVMVSVGAGYVFFAMAAIQYTEQVAPRMERLAERFPAAAPVLMRISALAAVLWR